MTNIFRCIALVTALFSLSRLAAADAVAEAPARNPAHPMNVPPLIQVKPSASFPKATWPREGVPDFVFVAHSHGGARAGVGVEEFDWKLEVDARAAAVVVESFRSDGDMPGHPLGLFRFSADDSLLRTVHQLAKQANLRQIAPAMKTHPAYTETRYYLQTADAATEDITINNGDHESMAGLATLNAQVTRLLAKAFEHPERAIRLSLEHRANPGRTAWEVKITNIGVEPVVIGDPRAIKSAGPLHQAVVMMTEFPATRPSDPPPLLNWREVPLEPLPSRPASEPLVTLKPGEVFQVGAPWDRPAKVRYLAYALLSNYQGDSSVGGVYRIRGRTQSNRVTLEP